MGNYAPPYPNAATDPFNQVPGMNQSSKKAATMADAKRLPEPPRWCITGAEQQAMLCEWATNYARACVEASLAALQAENERLRVEVDRLTGAAMAHCSQAVYANARAEKAEARAERLAEALRSSADALERLAFAIRAPNEHTPQLVELAIAMRAAALAQEDRNG